MKQQVHWCLSLSLSEILGEIQFKFNFNEFNNLNL